MNRKLRFLAGLAVIVGALAYLMITGFSRSAMYYFDIGELLDKGPSIQGKYVKVMGDVVTDSVSWDASTVTLRFEISDGARRLPVVYNDVQPDNIRDPGTKAVLEGRLGSDGVFVAEKLMLSCPSKYEAEKKPGGTN